LSDNKIIAVDLDGTLTFTDTLHESVVLLIRNNPLKLFKLPFWLAKGKAAFKAKLADQVRLNVLTLPYNQPLIDWLKKERKKGKRIVLCSATNEHIANAVADHLKIFDDVIASDASNNLKSTKKRNVLEKHFGKKGYDYAGNSSADIEVWVGARRAILVNTNNILNEKVKKITTISQHFLPRNITFLDYLATFRVHQWLKNLLLFVPLLVSHQIGNIQALSILILAFLSFSLCASAVYIINDLFDLESDRYHPRKRNRSFASALLPIVVGALIAPALIVASLALGWMVGTKFLVCLISYFILTTIYSMVLKRITLVDCLTLATLYTARIIAGAAAVSITPSFWLLLFSMFIFLSLAFMKRYAELKVQIQDGNTQTHGRAYVFTDAPLVQTLGVTSGYSAVLVLALYLQSEIVMILYAQPLLTLFAVPLLLFWISRMWMESHKGKMHDDPIIFAIKDKASLVVAILFLITFVLATTEIGS